MRVNFSRRWFLLFFSLTLASFLSIILFNYYFDGGNQFFHSLGFAKKLADAELQKNNVLVCTNYNERYYKKLLLEKLLIRPDILVLGSSRTMQLHQQLFGHATFFNASVSTVSLQDYIALYYLYQMRGWKPKVVILSLDHWLLDKNDNAKKWVGNFLTEYNAATQLFFDKQHGVEQARIRLIESAEKISTLLSVGYLKASVKKMPWVHRAVTKQLPIDDMVVNPAPQMRLDFPICYLEFPDGSKSSSVSEEQVSANEADAISRANLHQVTWSNQLHPESKQLLAEFVQYLLAQHIEVIFYLPPYAPAAYAEFQQDKHYQMVQAAEDYFLALAAAHHLQVVGSFNPEILQLDSSDFVDYVHLKQKGIDKIFNHFGQLSKNVTIL